MQMLPMDRWGFADWTAAVAVVVLGVFLALGGMIAASRKPEFAGHPKGLYMLFFAEMWERFSYYGMRALLIFYLTKHWLFDDGKSNLIYGAYTSLVYITPVLGGYLADRYLGQRKAVLFGAVLLSLGHLLMAVEGDGGQQSAAINVFWLALAFIIVNLIYGGMTGGSLRDVTIFGIPLGLIIGIVVVALAAMCLIQDFQQIDHALKAGIPERESWKLAFGLMVTLIWLYVEILRLLSYVMNRD